MILLFWCSYLGWIEVVFKLPCCVTTLYVILKFINYKIKKEEKYLIVLFSSKRSFNILHKTFTVSFFVWTEYDKELKTVVLIQILCCPLKIVNVQIKYWVTTMHWLNVKKNIQVINVYKIIKRQSKFKIGKSIKTDKIKWK